MIHHSMQELARAAIAAPSADNSQPWKLRISEGQLSAFAPPEPNFFGPGDHATLLSIGAVAENLVQTMAASQGGGQLKVRDLARGQPYFDVELASADQPLVVPPHILDRHTNRHPYASTPVPGEVVEPIKSLKEGAAKVVVLASQGELAEFIRISIICSESRFRTPELHRWLMDSLRYTAEEVARGDGLDMRTLHLPPGGRSFMRFIKDWRRMEFLNRFGAYRLLAQAEADVLRKTAAIVLITGRDGLKEAFDAGRLMERVWLALNAAGWAVQPAYVIPDQSNRMLSESLPRACREDIAKALADLRKFLRQPEQERLHIALRVGLATKTPVRSRRRSCAFSVS